MNKEQRKNEASSCQFLNEELCFRILLVCASARAFTYSNTKMLGIKLESRIIKNSAKGVETIRGYEGTKQRIVKRYHMEATNIYNSKNNVSKN